MFCLSIECGYINCQTFSEIFCKYTTFFATNTYHLPRLYLAACVAVGAVVRQSAQYVVGSISLNRPLIVVLVLSELCCNDL